MSRVTRNGTAVAAVGLLLMVAACSSSTSSKATQKPAPGPSAKLTRGMPTWTPKGALELASFKAMQSLDQSKGADIQRLSFKFGPIDVKPGQNLIGYSGDSVPKPKVDGYILKISPNIQRPDGTVPPVDVIHLHHGVWLNLSASDRTSPGLPERFLAAGEEKTVMDLPAGYGYAYHASDNWLINYMIHNLTPQPDKIYITYEIDFVPATSPAAKKITPAYPIWMDVQNGETYPVFDVIKGSGTNGTYTYPDQAVNPYPPEPVRRHHHRRNSSDGATIGSPTSVPITLNTTPPVTLPGGLVPTPPKNLYTVPNDMVLIGTGGHLHPGGLYDDLSVIRDGKTAHLFRSEAHYWEPAGAVSWDVALTVTQPNWRVALKKGDVLKISTTYDTSRASWYESMGIMITWATDGTKGPDPFTTKVDTPGYITHGPLPENSNHGGGPAPIPDPSKLATAPATGIIDISKYVYQQGDLGLDKPIPSVVQGSSLTFLNLDDKVDAGTWHSITACKLPCNKATGVAYPLADGDITFDSGQLGTGGPPTVDRVTWSTPVTLPPGTYAYFCRIHPFMRGAFSVVAKG